MSAFDELVLVWGSPGDIEMKRDGGGEYASTFKLTGRGIAKVTEAVLAEQCADEWTVTRYE